MSQVSNSIDGSRNGCFFCAKKEHPTQGAPKSGISFFGGFDVSRFPLLMKPEAVQSEYDCCNGQTFGYRQECSKKRQHDAADEHDDVYHYILPEFYLSGKSEDIHKYA